MCLSHFCLYRCALVIWTALQGLGKSTSNFDSVITDFACEGGTVRFRPAALIAIWHATVIRPSRFALHSAFGRFFRPLTGTSE